MSDHMEVRCMARPEVDELVDWAAKEGWNPGLHDADIFWTTDPEAIVAADLNGDMIGGGAIASYNGKFGFMGFFIVKPEYRGRGFGNRLWHVRRDLLVKRLQPNATIGMDGVYEMQDYYTQGGFVFSHRDLRYRLEIPESGLSPSEPGDGAVVRLLAEVSFDEILEYDVSCFAAPRPIFLKAWMKQPDSLALGCQKNGRLKGFGVIRACREGCKVGPLFSDDIQTADALFTRLTNFAAGGPVYLDAPENNPAALELVRQHGMTEVFGCARMYLGPAPQIAQNRIFGVTTFELG
ncbi:MAG: GNAT family N-acetyltransferase [Acidobacteriota bacterium]